MNYQKVPLINRLIREYKNFYFTSYMTNRMYTFKLRRKIYVKVLIIGHIYNSSVGPPQ